MPAKLHNISFALAVFASLQVGPVVGQLAPPTTGGVVELDRLLQRLGESRRVLVIAAHPDDEDTGLLSYMALAHGADAAYLSLTRGEGGQNLIGSELGAALGLLRSRELLAARGVDGTKQFFTRAFDFGFTRSLEETLVQWPRDSLLKDAVRVVRRFQPHVIVSVFSGTPRDGHGQHQAAGVIAQAVFDAAAEPSKFPELERDEGLAPWVPQRLFQSTRFRPGEASVVLQTGTMDTRLGRTVDQVAMDSRSRHRSQDMGRLQPIGPQQTGVRLVTDRTGSGSAPLGDLLVGIPTPASELRAFADSVRSLLRPNAPSLVAPALAHQLQREQPHTRSYGLLSRALAVASGVVVDAYSNDADVVPGQSLNVVVEVYNGGPLDVALKDIVIGMPAGWVATLRDDTASVANVLSPGDFVERAYTVHVPVDASPTQPYFLRRPMVGAMYDWSAAAPEVRGEPFQPPLLFAHVNAAILDAPLTLDREVSWRFGDQAIGEVRREIRVVPLVDVRLEPGSFVWSTEGPDAHTFHVTLGYNGSSPYRGSVRLYASGQAVTSAQPFAFEETGQLAELAFEVARPNLGSSGSQVLTAVAIGADGASFDLGVQDVDYPHIRPTRWIVPATANVTLAPLVLPDIDRIGYIRGAADRVPEALMQLGLPVELLAAEDLASRDLRVFDVIVVGSRAYETNEALTRHNDRLLAFNRGGGLLVVQYQQYAFVRGNFAPFPLTINRPHDRITDEDAPVHVLEPNHPVFQSPNVVLTSDWVGWPQERGLYFAGTWDDRYQPLLEMTDPGLEPVQGGLLVAPNGSGLYVYTGIAFFRSLPAGVPGPFKLFLNLLGLRPDRVP